MDERAYEIVFAGKRRCSANEGEKQKVPSPDSATVFFAMPLANTVG